MDLASLPITPFPPLKIRKQALGWEACIPSWTLVCEKLLCLPDEVFGAILQIEPSSPISVFLISFVENNVDSQRDERWLTTENAQQLSYKVFLVHHRIFSQLESPPTFLLQWSFLGHFCKVFRQQKALHDLMENTCNNHRFETSLQKYKDVLISRFEKRNGFLTDDGLFVDALIPLFRASPSAGTYFLTGSDLLDALISAYGTTSGREKSRLLILAYLMLLAPLQAPKMNESLLREHLFTLRADAESMEKSGTSQHSLLSDLVTETPFFAKLRKQATSGPDKSRCLSLISSIERFGRAESSDAKKPRRRKKVQSQRVDDFGHGETFHGIHIHQMSKITQIQDIFPDLGSGYIVRLLDEYDDDAEQVTAHLLEDTLPLYLQELDRTAQLKPYQSKDNSDLVPGLAPHGTPTPSPPSYERRNVFDNDEFDRLAISKSQLYLGRKDTDAAARQQDFATRITAKAAILSALAAFDADDDERDDTYDLEDVGGTVDKVPGSDEDEDITINDMREKNEETLFSAWKMNPSAFGRESKTKRGTARQTLKSETGMTDEAIEGWALMLSKDPGRLRRMEARYASFGGQQRELKPTAWRGGPETDDDEGTSGTDTPRGGHRRGHRGRGRGGQGGNVAGPSDDKGTQVSRDRKEANKGSRANHNRRDQRARKMARGGGMA